MIHHLPDTETSAPDALEPLEREILVLVVDVDSDDLDELHVGPPGGGAPDEHPPPSVAAATLV